MKLEKFFKAIIDEDRASVVICEQRAQHYLYESRRGKKL